MTMAILNTVEGQAHVESNRDLLQWSGYIVIPNADFGDIRYFDIAGPASQGIYEGPVVIEGKYYFANGKVTIAKVKFSSPELRVEFGGIEKLNMVNPLSGIPDDFLP